MAGLLTGECTSTLRLLNVLIQRGLSDTYSSTNVKGPNHTTFNRLTVGIEHRKTFATVLMVWTRGKFG